MRRVAAGVVVLLFAVGCGVPLDGAPRQVSAGDVPFELLNETTTTRVPTVARPFASVTIFLVQNERLVERGRGVEQPATLRQVLAALLNGPAEADLVAGIRSAISASTALRDVQVEAGVATVDLSSAFVGTSGRQQILALAQIVYTATGVPGIAGVRFALDGRPVEVPRGDGRLTSGPLTRADFAAFAPA